MTNENALATLDNFVLPSVSGENVEQQIDDLNDFEGIIMTFPRIKIPGGGSTLFEIPGASPDKPDYVPAIEGILIYNHNTNAYWEEGSEYDMNTSPVCSSPDGKTGYGEPGGAVWIVRTISTNRTRTAVKARLVRICAVCIFLKAENLSL